MKYLNTLHGRVELFGFFWFSRIHRVRKLGLDNAGTDLRNPDVVRPERTNLGKNKNVFSSITSLKTKSNKIGSKLPHNMSEIKTTKKL